MGFSAGWVTDFTHVKREQHRTMQMISPENRSRALSSNLWTGGADIRKVGRSLTLSVSQEELLLKNIIVRKDNIVGATRPAIHLRFILNTSGNVIYFTMIKQYVRFKSQVYFAVSTRRLQNIVTNVDKDTKGKSKTHGQWKNRTTVGNKNI